LPLLRRCPWLEQLLRGKRTSNLHVLSSPGQG